MDGRFSRTHRRLPSPTSRRIRTLDAYQSAFADEGIGALAFIPLVSSGRVIGKFMLYHDAPRVLADDERQLAEMIAAQVAFALERSRAEASLRRSDERLRFALEAAAMGTWEMDLADVEP